jgi:methylated-DNA-[protein]-cysteine S-methyltransferase
MQDAGSGSGGQMSQMGTTHTTINSPLGDLTAVARPGGVARWEMAGLYFPRQRYRPSPSAFGVQNDDGFADLRRQLDEYFAGERHEFAIASRPDGDDLQRRVWDLVQQIRYGETATYGQLARELGDGTTPQEVGVAIGRNPLCILVPCHRVIGSSGKLTGYAGGLWRKHFLLDLEGSSAEHPVHQICLF